MTRGLLVSQTQHHIVTYCPFCLFICLLLLFCCQYWDGDKQGWGEKQLHWHTLHPYTTPVPWVSSHALHADRGESVSDRGDPAAVPPSPPQHLPVTLMAVTRLPTVRLSPVMKLPWAHPWNDAGNGNFTKRIYFGHPFFGFFFISENVIKIDPVYFF